MTTPTKKQNLIAGLKTAINSLVNDTVWYDWRIQTNCNCGVVVQAMTNQSPKEIEKHFDFFISEFNRIKNNRGREIAHIDRTWQNAVKYVCPVSGLTGSELFDQLAAVGMSKEDIVHLEYMSNRAILERSKIRTFNYEYKEHHPNKIKAFFGVTVTKTIAELPPRNFFSAGTNVLQKNIAYWKSKENLIKYLKAWVEILEEEPKQELTAESELVKLNQPSKIELEADLLRAVASEDYEKATKLRDMINA